jgi:hypothetical protein
MITIEFDKARRFTEREGRIYSTLIDQAGVAIDNRLLLRQTEAEVARNENLYAASRIINTAQTPQDLVQAAAATSEHPDLHFALSMLEGELDENGWPGRARMLARSDGMNVEEVSLVYPLHIAAGSPILDREPETVLDDIPSSRERLQRGGVYALAGLPLHGGVPAVQRQPAHRAVLRAGEGAGRTEPPAITKSTAP